jgi:hypothetical protein
VVRGGYLDVLDAVEKGYIVVIQDVRGRFASEGEFRRQAQVTYKSNQQILKPA